MGSPALLSSGGLRLPRRRLRRGGGNLTIVDLIIDGLVEALRTKHPWSRDATKRGNMESDLQAIDRRIGELAKADDEAMGRIVGIAAVVALLPGTGAVTVPAAKAVIAELMQYVVGAGPEAADIAIRTAYVVTAAAQKAAGSPDT